jgi:hypothetical protein
MPEIEIDLDTMMRESVEAERSNTQEGAGEGVPSAVATPSAEAAPVSTSTEPAESPQAPETGERPRGPDGKFIKADEGKAPAETGKQPENQTPAAAQTGEQPQQNTDQAVTQGIQAPVSWSPAAKQEFSKLPIAVQEAVAKREMEVSNGFKQYGEKVKQYEAIDKVLEPLTPMLQQHGLTKDQYVQRLRAAEVALESNPVEGIKWLAKSYGVDLSKLTGQPPGEQPYVDPDIQALKQELAELRSQQTNWLQANQAAVANEVAQEVERFKSETNPDGTLKHEFFDQVRPILAQMNQAGEVKDLKSAYDEACWRHPQVRQILQARHADSIQKKLREEAAKKVQTAAPAIGTNVRGNGHAAMPVGNWEDTLLEVTRAAVGR